MIRMRVEFRANSVFPPDMGSEAKRYAELRAIEAQVLDELVAPLLEVKVAVSEGDSAPLERVGNAEHTLPRHSR